jgi:predicted CoA-binding protein
MTNDKIREFQALVNLIDEPDPEMYEIIEKRVLEHGFEIMPVLQEALGKFISGKC